MKHVTNDKPPRPTLPSSTLALLLATALAGTIAKPASAQAIGAEASVQIVVTPGELRDARSLAQIRRQIVNAARTLCDSGGIASLYRNGAQRCRERLIASGQRQLEARIATRLAVAVNR